MSNSLMEKLAISKAIMDKHNQISRGKSQDIPVNISTPEIQNFNTPEIRYNIPQELIGESRPIQNTNAPATKDRILSSKLPDEIKRLMIENPIAQVNPMSPSNSVLSDELIEKATKLMGTNKSEYQPASQITNQTTNSNGADLRKMIKEVVTEVLKENGLMLESTSKTDQSMVIKVGQHIFEGKISKIKKIKQ